jgi:hypothetical protein
METAEQYRLPREHVERRVKLPIRLWSALRRIQELDNVRSLDFIIMTGLREYAIRRLGKKTNLDNPDNR